MVLGKKVSSNHLMDWCEVLAVAAGIFPYTGKSVCMVMQWMDWYQTQSSLA